MRIAIFHDYFGSIGGGEKLVIELAHQLDADIYTTEIYAGNLKKINTYGVNVRVISKCIDFPILKQVHASLIFHNADIRGMGYDAYVMSGNWSIFACRRHHPNVHYVHTPPRMLYDGKKEFYTIAPWYAKSGFLLWTLAHTLFYNRQIRHVDSFIANSDNVRNRIRKYYKKNSRIIYPPCKRYPFVKYGDFWLCISRFYPHKRLELAIEAFRKMPQERLIIVGGYMRGDHAAAYASKIMKDLPGNVRVIREVGEDRLGELYGACKGFITMSMNEDFGMTVVEANSAGKPVIAVDKGGHRETVVDEMTGLLIAASPDAICSAVSKLEEKIRKNPKELRRVCESNYERFSVERFCRAMEIEIKRVIEHSDNHTR